MKSIHSFETPRMILSRIVSACGWKYETNCCLFQMNSWPWYKIYHMTWLFEIKLDIFCRGTRSGKVLWRCKWHLDVPPWGKLRLYWRNVSKELWKATLLLCRLWSTSAEMQYKMMCWAVSTVKGITCCDYY